MAAVRIQSPSCRFPRGTILTAMAAFAAAWAPSFLLCSASILDLVSATSLSFRSFAVAATARHPLPSAAAIRHTIPASTSAPSITLDVDSSISERDAANGECRWSDAFSTLDVVCRWMAPARYGTYGGFAHEVSRTAASKQYAEHDESQFIATDARPDSSTASKAHDRKAQKTETAPSR